MAQARLRTWMHVWFFCALALGSALPGCAAPTGNYPYAKEPDPRRTEYVIGVPDVLRVRVWRHGDLGGDVQVRPDGTVTFPLIGDVPAAGNTPTQLKKIIADRLATYVKIDGSSVTVEVSQINSYRVTVNGNITSPGVLQSARYLTVGEAISLSGGPNQYAAAAETVIVRTRANGKVDRIPIRYDLLIEGRALEQDIVLLSGDIVYVP